MIRFEWSRQTALKIALLLIGLAVLLMSPLPLPDRIGAVDFRPYWSASLLLARGQDFSDPTLLDDVERNLTGWTEPFTMVAWFAPSGNLVLLPYTLVSFGRAAYYWLLTNILVVFSFALLLWRGTLSRAWIPIVATFGFSMTLVSIIYGQVNTLVVLGLALFLHLSAQKRGLAAGAGLALTTIKPHLVILALPLLVLDLIRRGEWRVLAGFVGALAGAGILLFALFPAWPLSFWALVRSGMSTIRATPTLNGLLVVGGEVSWGKWVWLGALVLAAIIWWRRGRNWDRRTMIDVSILAGMVVAPVGWSYDQIILLVPVLRILRWAVDGSLTGRDAFVVVAALILMDAVTFYQRFLALSEVWYFWVPLVVAAVYGFAWGRSRASSLRPGEHAHPISTFRSPA